MYQTKDNFKGLMMLAQSYSHSYLSRTQEGWLPHMDFPILPLFVMVMVCYGAAAKILPDFNKNSGAEGTATAVGREPSGYTMGYGCAISCSCTRHSNPKY